MSVSHIAGATFGADVSSTATLTLQSLTVVPKPTSMYATVKCQLVSIIGHKLHYSIKTSLIPV